MVSIGLEGLAKSYGGSWSLGPLSLDVDAGECIVLLGPSGCGKTTILRLIAGLEVPNAGRIRIDGVDVAGVPPHARGVALVTQRAVLYPHLDVQSNLLFGLHSRASLDEAVEAFGLGEFLQRMPWQLSGGQQQRVALAHAMLRRASIVLLDEPFANLDSASRWELLVQLPLLRRRLPFTMIIVTHEQAEAFALAGRVALLASGRLIQDGPPAELYSRPVSVSAARLLGWPPMNLFPGKVREAGSAFEVPGQGLPLPEGLSAWGRFEGRPVLVGARPGALVPGPAGWPIVPVGAVPGGEGGWRLVQVAGQLAAVAEGEGDHVFFKPEAAHLFDADTGEALAHGHG